MRKAKYNKGFTLVESIIAVADLGIVISPLVANFIQSAKLNKKARISLNATNMAQDIMEGASSYTADEFIKMFESEQSLMGKLLPAIITGYNEHGDMDSTNTNKSFQYDVNSSTASGARQYAGAVNSSGVVTELDNLSENMYFYVEGVKQGNNNYNLRFHVTTNGANTSANGAEVANIAKINSSYDLTQTLDTTNQKNNDPNEGDVARATKYFVDHSSSTDSNLEANIKAALERQIKITVTKDASNNHNVTFEQIYSVPTTQLSSLGLTASDQTVPATEFPTVTLLANAKQMPRSIYLYYVGMPNSQGTVGSTKVADKFEVKNTTGSELTVYLIRMQDGSKKTQASSITYNNNYRAQVEVFSEEPTGIPNDLTSIVSNLRYNLSEDASKNYRVFEEGSSTTKLAGITDEQKNNTKYSADRCTYTYNSMPVDETQYKKVISDGYQKQNKNFIYEVTLEVEDAAKGTKVATFTGSLAE